MERPSRRFRASFPNAEPGFRTGAWSAGVPGFGDDVELLSETTVEALRLAATEARVGIRLYPDDERDPISLVTYADLLERVRRGAGRLREYGIERGDRVLLVLPTSIELVVAFFATQWVGAIPVPSYPPPALERLETAIDRLVHIGANSQAKVLITTASLRTVLGDVARRVKSLELIVRGDSLEKGQPVASAVGIDPSNPCFIQYTSGSTGHPKGVLLTHANITSNVHAAGLALAVRRDDSVASWLPLYHDMGLIGGLLMPIYWRLPLALMSPLAFLSQPPRWLKMISESRSTMSPAPNFGYALAMKRTTAEERAKLDLSSWRIAMNGAEPVNERTVREFCEAFADAGFQSEAIFPCYGLAEASVAVTFPAPGSPLRTKSVDRQALANGYVEESDANDAVRLVGCGKPVPAHQVLVLDETGEPSERGEVGHIVVRGPSVMEGYFEDPETTQRVLRDGYLWTGDLGFQEDGVLFITGRAKDLIIVRGKNFYAEDVEQCLERVPEVRPGGAVAFAVYDDARARDATIAVCETKETDTALRASLVERLTSTVSEACGLSLEEVVLVEPGTIPKTSSGKKQRSLTRDRYLEGALAPVRTDTLGAASVFVRSAVGAIALAGRRMGAAKRRQDTD
jgi:acyl-CoA synthetase (AMP-forming)/AMP-acid ligase II